jgi:hypothetical protein
MHPLGDGIKASSLHRNHALAKLCSALTAAKTFGCQTVAHIDNMQPQFGAKLLAQKVHTSNAELATSCAQPAIRFAAETVQQCGTITCAARLRTLTGPGGL